MRNDFACSLNGLQFNLLDDLLYIQDIEEQIKMGVETAKRPYYGSFLVGTPGHDSLAVTITFMVKQCDRAARQAIIQKVNGWAKEGWLTVSTRPGQQLYVVCTQPANTKAFEWSDDLSVVFTAYQESYWQDVEGVTDSGSGTSVDLSLTPSGTRPCCLCAEITSTENTIDTLTISTVRGMMRFEGLSLAPQSVLTIGYNERHLLYVTADGLSKLACRTGQSSDDLWLEPNISNAISIVADGAFSAVITAKGEYD